MTQIPENFTILAETLTYGMSEFHQKSEHRPEECLAWQHGVLEFAKWLDDHNYLLECSDSKGTT